MDNLINNCLGGLLFDSAAIQQTGDHNKLRSYRVLNSFALILLLEGHGEVQHSSSGWERMGLESQFHSRTGKVPASSDRSKAPALPVKKGELFFIFPGVPHRYGPPDGQRWKEYWTIFRGRGAEELYRQGIISPARSLFRPPSYRLPAMETIFHRLGEIHRKKPFEGEIEANSLLVRLLSLALLSGPGDGHNSTSIDAMKELLARHVESGRRVSSFFRFPGHSYHTMRSRFSRELGISPGQYLLKLKMERAGELLARTDLPIREVAEMVGFDDPFHFSRVCKRETGLSPRAYRRQFLADTGGN